MPNPPDIDDPTAWTGPSPLLDLADTRLRLKAQALTQLGRSDRDKAVAIYAFVKRIPFVKPMKLRLQTARQVLDRGKGDAEDKASLFIALLRLGGVPSRLCYVELHGDILRGLTSAIASAGRPVAQVWLDGGWRSTDTYIFDAPYVAAARQKLRENGWDWGYGLHRLGHTVWGGTADTFLTGTAETTQLVSLGTMGHFHDPGDFLASDICRERFPRIARAVRWNMLSPSMNRAVTALRSGNAGTPPPASRRPA